MKNLTKRVSQASITLLFKLFVICIFFIEKCNLDNYAGVTVRNFGTYISQFESCGRNAIAWLAKMICKPNKISLCALFSYVYGAAALTTLWWGVSHVWNRIGLAVTTDDKCFSQHISACCKKATECSPAHISKYISISTQAGPYTAVFLSQNYE